MDASEIPENIENFIACGEIPRCPGVAYPAVTSCTIERAPLNSSGYFGVATIDLARNDRSNVSAPLFHLDRPAAS